METVLKRCVDLCENIGIDLSIVDVDTAELLEVCDSLQFIALVCDIEKEFDIEVPDDMLVIETKIGAFLDCIEAVVEQSSQEQGGSDQRL